MRTILEIIWNGLKTKKVAALLIGGHALPAFGVARQTIDIDCLIVDSDSKVLHDILTKAGYKEKLESICTQYGPDGIYAKLESYL